MPTNPTNPANPTAPSGRPEIVYGVKAIAREINEPNERKANYRLARGYVRGAWKAGHVWALSVPVFRRSAGLDPAA
jgi:hypothetical protein